MYNFQLIKNKDTGSTKVVEELDDDLFKAGWRLVKYLKNSEVDYVKYNAEMQNEADKRNNEPVFDCPPLKIEHDENFKESLFKDCSNWRYEKDSVFEKEVKRVKSYRLATYLFINQ